MSTPLISIHERELFARLCKERKEAVIREFAAEDDGSFDRALKVLDEAESLAHRASEPILVNMSKPAERVRGIRI